MRRGPVDRVGQAGRVGCLLLLLAATSCRGSTSTTAATTTPVATRTTDTFTGTVAIGGSDFHSFPVAAAGAIDVTLTSTAPPSAIVMGISVGVPADGKCAPLAGASTKAAAGSAVQLSGTTSPGTFCVDVHDAGSQAAAVSYTVTVTHP